MSSPRNTRSSTRTPSRSGSEADRPVRSPAARRTPSRSSRSDTPASTPLRFGARRPPAAGQDNVVEPSDPLSQPPSSPGPNIVQPTSPFGVGKFL